MEIIEQGQMANLWVWSKNGSSDSGDHTVNLHFHAGKYKNLIRIYITQQKEKWLSPSTAFTEEKLNPELFLYFSAIYLCIFTLPSWISMSVQPAQIYCARFSPQGNSGNDVDAMWINLAHSPSAPCEVKLSERWNPRREIMNIKGCSKREEFKLFFHYTIDHTKPKNLDE